jgi:hypothetical protein
MPIYLERRQTRGLPVTNPILPCREIPPINPLPDPPPPPPRPLTPPTTTINTMGTSSSTGPTTGPTTHSSIKFNPPTVFNSSFKDYKCFICELLIFLMGYQVTDDTIKITTTLSFIRGGYADEFIQETVNLASAADPTCLDWGTWTTFITRLDNHFKDKNFTQSS